MDPTGSINEIKIITLFVTFLQLVSILFIILMNVILIRHLRNPKINAVSASRRVNKFVLLQVIIVTGSNILCWLPSSCIFLVSLFLSSYTIHLLFWNTIAIMPINSILNPLIFLLISLRTQNVHKGKNSKPRH